MSTPPHDPVGEADLLDTIRGIVSERGGVRLGIGDDAALLDLPSPVVAALDMLVEDVHFRWRTCSPEDVGHKALAVNLSDLAAMGAVPVAALVGLGVAPGTDLSTVERIYRGMEALAGATGCTVAGGDLSRCGIAVVSVTVLGRMEPGVSPVLRDGAAAGDTVSVTDPLGASAAGLALLEDESLPRPAGADRLLAAYRRPDPRIDLGPRLARYGVHAMLDCSDGLVQDAGRMAEASGVGIEIELERVPVAPGVAEVASRLGADPAEFAATGGEDYALIVAHPDPLPAEFGAVPVGRVLAGPAEVRVTRGGVPTTLPRGGWEHRFDGG